jgi:putative tryptophan/tyrosine transport system substrate-binding protein
MLQQSLRELGWEYGREYQLLSPDIPAFTEITDEQIRTVVETRPDLILTFFHAARIQHFTASIPIVTVANHYPVEEGVAESLARPGRNVTGNTLYVGSTIWPKLIELVREIQPGTRKVVALLANPRLIKAEPDAQPASELQRAIDMRVTEKILSELRQIERSFGVEITPIDTRDRPSRATLAQIAGAQPDALLFVGQGSLPLRQEVMALAATRKLPTIDGFSSAVPAELMPLLFYTPALLELYRSAADYMVRILNGTPAGDLPIQQPTHYSLTLNMAAARANDLAVPDSVFLRADHVLD